VVLLLIVGVICVIELRAGLGQMLSGKALAARSNDGEFTELSLDEAVGLLTMAPQATVETRHLDSIHRYEWYSVLRPLIGQQNPQVTIISSNEEKPMALAFTTADEEPESAPVPASAGETSSPMADPGGMMGAGMGAGGGMRSAPNEDAGRKRPEMEETAEPAEPTRAAEPASTEPASAEGPLTEPASTEAVSSSPPAAADAPTATPAPASDAPPASNP
jgi:hypothetical protein